MDFVMLLPRGLWMALRIKFSGHEEGGL